MMQEPKCSCMRLLLLWFVHFKMDSSRRRHWQCRRRPCRRRRCLICAKLRQAVSVMCGVSSVGIISIAKLILFWRLKPTTSSIPSAMITVSGDCERKVKPTVDIQFIWIENAFVSSNERSSYNRILHAQMNCSPSTLLSMNNEWNRRTTNTIRTNCRIEWDDIQIY